MFFQNFGEMRKRCNFFDITKPLNANSADGVQWRRKSDYSICISQEGGSDSIVFRYWFVSDWSLPVWRHIATSERFGQPVHIAVIEEG